MIYYLTRSLREDYIILVQESSKFPRYYKLPISKFCPENCKYCHGLGQKIDSREFHSLEAHLEKAKLAEYQWILLPCNSHFSKDLPKIVSKITEQNFKTLLQINFTSVSNHFLKGIRNYLNENVKFQLVIGEWKEDFRSYFFRKDLLQNLESILVVVNDELSLSRMIQSMPEELHSKMSFQFPFKFSKSDCFLTTDEIYRTLSKLQKGFPQVNVSPSQGVLNFDPRIEKSFDFEPNFYPLNENINKNSNIDYSVVIPTFNNLSYIKNVFRHLSYQLLDKEKYEVILVDDGSTDQTKAFFSQLSPNHFSGMQWRYIYYPRKSERKRGDNQFRAGIARNLGVKYARGSHLCFLDSDILVPPNFLSQLLREHKTWDVIQARRTYLTESASSEFTSYSEELSEQDTFNPEGGYWNDFFNDPSPWHTRENNWKYVCTYTLSMKTSDFKKVGRFKTNFHYYGFEDTDLGYRLVQSGCRLHLTKMNVLHLWHSNDKSEFKNSDMQRHLLLKKTANIFYRNQLDGDIFRDLNSLVHEEGFIKYIQRGVRNLVKPTSLQKSLKSPFGKQ